MTIHAETIACMEGSAGLITLDSPRSLNALSEDMIIAMQRHLDAWAEDPDICLVILQGAGERAFCAGGDIRQLYDVLGTDQSEAEATRYFNAEYRLDYTLHTYRKPLICWAHGVVMGGGLGLLAASRYRLLTPSAQLAMPEISIGLFPDVGAGYFLNRLPEGMGLFLGLTGARLNQIDSLRSGCPTSAGLVFEQLKHARQLSLKEIFRTELAMAVNCCAGKDLKEGIRARLIDKDQQPKWQYSSVEELSADDVSRYFTPPWPTTDNPLADLD